MTNQEKFKVLADQIKISNQLESDILQEGELTRIDVSTKTEHGSFKFHYHAFSLMKIIFYLLMQLKKNSKK